MEDTKLRHLERQYKLRVKTGCETCRYVLITSVAVKYKRCCHTRY
jgi:hypothetical protein